jgi:hypothetical protein
MAKLTFDAWKAMVDKAIADKTGGFTGDDLPNWDYWTAWDSGVSATTAAARVIRAARGY